MVANYLSGSVKKLSVTGETSNMEEALFEVKNKNGQTVFAVYNEGVRIYVDNGVKGAKGGFSVGGFGDGKKASRKYLFVSPDSIRAYIDTATVKGPKGGFSVGGFTDTKSKPPSFFNINPDNEAIIDPSENRILYYPVKNSFLVGRVIVEDPDSVGTNSVATGYESKAIGNWSQAMGYKSIARGDYSTAIGKKALARYKNSFALGDSSRALYEGAYAFGYKTEASGFGSLAFGYAYTDAEDREYITRAMGASSIAIGIGARALADGAVAVGAVNEASAPFSLSLGLHSVASNEYATALGYEDTASGYSSYSAGMWNKATGDYSYVVGYNSVASGEGAAAMAGNGLARGDLSVVMGYETEAGAKGAFAIGFQSHSDGQFSFAGGNLARVDSLADYSFSYGLQTRSKNICNVVFGNGTEASGYAAVAMGAGSKASGDKSFAIGNNTKAVSTNSTAIGTYNVGLSNSILEIGNGSNDLSRSNALTVLDNGNTGIAMANPQQRLDISGGNGRVESGYNWLTNSDIRFKKNITTIENPLDKVKSIRGVSFDLINYTPDSGTVRKNIGFIAQELETVIPEVVITSSDGYKSVAYDKITAVLTEAIKEQQKQIESYKSENDDLKTQLQILKEEVEQIKAFLATGGGK